MEVQVQHPQLTPPPPSSMYQGQPPPLTSGAIQALFAGEPDLQPILQVLNIRKVPNNNDAKVQYRVRLILSDGIHYLQCNFFSRILVHKYKINQ